MPSAGRTGGSPALSPTIFRISAATATLALATSTACSLGSTSSTDWHRAQRPRSISRKTNLPSCIISQGLRREEEFWCADPKMVSLSYFAGVPGFLLASDPGNPDEMAELVLGFAADGRTRGRTSAVPG